MTNPSKLHCPKCGRPLQVVDGEWTCVVGEIHRTLNPKNNSMQLRISKKIEILLPSEVVVFYLAGA